MYTKSAVVTVKDGDKLIGKQEYQKVIFEGMQADEKGKPTGGTKQELLKACIDFLTGKSKEGDGVGDLLSYATYAYDLAVRGTIRAAIEKAAEGPDKVIEKTIKDLMAARAAAGKPITEDEARKKVLALME